MRSPRRHRSALISIPVIAALLVAAARPALADLGADLTRARHLKANLRYAEALEATEAALASGEADARSLAEIHRLRGELAAGLDQPEAATRSFAAYLSLDPRGSLGAGVSPKLTAPFDRARRELGGRAVAIRVRLVDDAFEIEIEDPAVLIARLDALRGNATTLVNGPPYSYPHRPGDEQLAFVALDRHGNVVAEAGPVAPALEGATTARSSLISSPLPWAIGASALAATALTFGLLARSDQSELDDLNQRARDEPFTVSYDMIREVEDRGKTRALVTNIAAAAAGAAAATALILWLTGDSHASEPATVRIQVSGSGITAGVGVSF